MNKRDNILNNKQDAHPQAGSSSSKDILRRGKQHEMRYQQNETRMDAIATLTWVTTTSNPTMIHQYEQ